MTDATIAALRVGWRPQNWHPGMHAIDPEDGSALGVVVHVSDEHPGMPTICFLGADDDHIRVTGADTEDSLPDLSDAGTIACCLAELARRVGLLESPVPFNWKRYSPRPAEPERSAGPYWALSNGQYAEEIYGAVGAELDPLAALALALRDTVEKT